MMICSRPVMVEVVLDRVLSEKFVPLLFGDREVLTNRHRAPDALPVYKLHVETLLLIPTLCDVFSAVDIRRSFACHTSSLAGEYARP